jgi:hypothetical protein
VKILGKLVEHSSSENSSSKFEISVKIKMVNQTAAQSNSISCLFNHFCYAVKMKKWCYFCCAVKMQNGISFAMLLNAK